jgi:hypothetical protein
MRLSEEHSVMKTPRQLSAQPGAHVCTSKNTNALKGRMRKDISLKAKAKKSHI